jgi:hypothetical protein
MCIFFHFLRNKCIINYNFWEKTIALRKMRRLYRWTLYFFSFFFGLVMCHESQTWGLMAIEKMYVIYFMHIDFIQFFSSNYWIKLNFDPNDIWFPKCCHSHSNCFFHMFRISKRCHQDFSLLHTYHTCYISFFWVKSGPSIVWFHLTFP